LNLLISRKIQYFFLKKKKRNKETNFFFLKSRDKCKISLYGWPKLQIARSSIKNNLKVFRVGQNNNLVPTTKFRQNT
jgi:hypothetical protein